MQKFIMIICLISGTLLTTQLNAQKIGIGIMYGTDLNPTINVDNEEVNIEGERMMQRRIGVNLRYKPNDFLQLKTGVEFFNRQLRVENLTYSEPNNYDLQYIYIPLTASMKIYEYESFTGTSFIGFNYGLGAEILNKSTLNMVEMETEFNTFTLNGLVGAYYGFELIENLNLSINGNVQYTFNPIVDGDFTGKGRGLFFLAQANLYYYF